MLVYLSTMLMPMFADEVGTYQEFCVFKDLFGGTNLFYVMVFG